MGPTIHYEAYCDHCHAGVYSRDALTTYQRQHLCASCFHARETLEKRILRISGWLLLGCVLAGGGLGYALFSLTGIYPGLILGVFAAALIEGRLKRF